MEVIHYFKILTLISMITSCTAADEKFTNKRSPAQSNNEELKYQKEEKPSSYDKLKKNDCSLESRITKHTVELPEELSIGSESAYLHSGSYTRDWYNFSKVLPVITKQNKSGKTVIGWQDSSGNTHISILSNDLKEIEKATSFPSKRLRDIFIDHEEVATLALEGNRMVLRNYDHSLSLKWKKVFQIRDYSSSMHNGRITKRADGGYVAYFGVHGMGGHEGDALQQVDKNGEYDNRGNLSWTWGCSHSLDQRLLRNGDGLMPICIGDYYPAGLTQRATGRSQVISKDIKHKNGLGSPNLGGTVEYKGHFVSVISSAFGRSNRDIAIVAFEKAPPYKTKGRVWLTNTDTNEVKPKITIENNELFVFFHTQGEESSSFTARKLKLEFDEATFSINELSNEKIELEIGPMEDIVSFQQNRPIIAARVKSEPNKLLVQSFENCQ